MSLITYPRPWAPGYINFPCSPGKGGTVLEALACCVFPFARQRLKPFFSLLQNSVAIFLFTIGAQKAKIFGIKHSTWVPESKTCACHCSQSPTTLLWQSLKVLSRMISHFRAAQALQYGFESHGKVWATVSEHSWLVFQLFPNSSAPAATDEYLVVKSSLRSPLLFPQRPHTLPYIDQKGNFKSELC